MVIMKPLKGKVKREQVNLCGGLNQNIPIYEIDDSETQDCHNVFSSFYPYLSTRPARKTVFNGAANGIYGFAETNVGSAIYTYLDGTTWKYWNGIASVNIQTGLTAKKTVIKTFNIGDAIAGSTINVDGYSESNQSGSYSLYNGSTILVGQSFSPQTDAEITACKFYLKKNGSPTGNVYAYLYSAEEDTTYGTYKPAYGSSPLATSSAIDISTLTTSFALITPTFTSTYKAGKNGKYAVIVRYEGGDSSNYLVVGYDSSSPTHSGNLIYGTDDGTYDHYYTNASYDTCFYVIGTRISGGGYVVLMNGTNKYAWDGTTITTLTDAPSSSIFTVHKNRLFVASGRKVSYTALNSISDFTTSGSAGSFYINSFDDITGIASYNDRLIIFTPSSIHMLLGTSPSDFQAIDISTQIGCLADATISECNGVLYWLGNNQTVYEYSGGTPTPISEPFSGNGVSGGIKDYLETVCNNYAQYSLACAGSYKNYYMLSVALDDGYGNNHELVFDTKNRKWFMLKDFFDYWGFSAFYTGKDTLYGVYGLSQNLHYGSYVYDMFYYDGEEQYADNQTGDSNEDRSIYWYWYSKKFKDTNLSNEVTLAELWLHYELICDETWLATNLYNGLRIYIRTSKDDTLQEIFTTSTNLEGVQKIRIPLSYCSNVDWYQFLIDGYSHCKLRFERVLRVRG